MKNFILLILALSTNSFACPGSGTTTLYVGTEAKRVEIGTIQNINGTVKLEKGYTLTDLKAYTLKAGVVVNTDSICTPFIGINSDACSSILDRRVGAYIIKDKFRKQYDALKVQISQGDSTTLGFVLKGLAANLDENQPRMRGGCGEEAYAKTK